MLDPHFLPATVLPAPRSDVFGPLQGGERGLWQGRCAVAEYAFDETASLPRWVLPETTEVLVTDHRLRYAYTRSDSPDDLEVTSGELRWLWPQHLRVQPGARTAGRAAAAAQIQLVCAAADGSFPALVFAGGELGTVADADRLANLIRHAIARFRVDNAERLGLSASQARMLSRLLIGPEFSNFQGGEGQTVTMLGALAVHRPAHTVPAAASPQAEYPHAEYSHAEYSHADSPHVGYPRPVEPEFGEPETDSLLLASLHPDLSRPHDLAHATAAEAPPPYGPDHAALAEWQQPPGPDHATEGPYPASVSGTTMRLPGYRPGLAADEARALQAVAAEQNTHLTQPDLASRAARLAAQVASLVSAAEEAAEAQAMEARAAEARAAAARDAEARAAAQAAEAQAAEAARAAEAQAAAEWAAAEVRAAQARAAQAQAAAEQAMAAQAAAEQAADSAEVPTTDLTARAERVRRAAARFAANSARGKAGTRRPDQDLGSTSRGNRTY